MAGWITRLIVPGLVFIAALTGVLVVLLQALWDYMQSALTARAGTPAGSRLPSDQRLRR